MKMVIVGTKIGSSDNSGIKAVNCIKILGSHRFKLASIGDRIIASIINVNSLSTAKLHEVHSAIIIRTRRPFFRRNGSLISFQYNVVVVVDTKKNTPIASRIDGPILYEMRRKYFLKIISIARTIM